LQKDESALAEQLRLAQVELGLVQRLFDQVTSAILSSCVISVA
jgi:hypothetical protein